MATNTYVPLAKQTVSGSTVAQITLSGISQDYTDLKLVYSGGFNGNVDNWYRYNGDNASTGLYATQLGEGNGTSPSAYHYTNTNQINTDSIGTNTGQKSTIIMDIIGYSNTTTFKSSINRQAAKNVNFSVGLYRSTSAINRIDYYCSGYFADGATLSLYGIAREGISGTKATGGVVYSDSTYYYHVFNSSGTFTPTTSISADILVVAGGGGGYGGGVGGGGGGAGGLLTYTSQSLSATGYAVTVGAGGTRNGNGSSSQFGALTASVGGGAGGSSSGSAGGSGGGAGGNGGSVGGRTSGQGNYGGYGNATYGTGGGGGGAGAAGADGIQNGGGDGGIGATSAFINAIGAATGAGQYANGNTYFAGGGGGGNANHDANTKGLGGLGGGGWSYGSGGSALRGYPNTGGGGGAGSANRASSDELSGGGSGIVVVRYAK